MKREPGYYWIKYANDVHPDKWQPAELSDVGEDQVWRAPGSDIWIWPESHASVTVGPKLEAPEE